MAITTSEIIKTATQIDGRSYVTERHVTDLGREIFVEYLADIGYDTNAMLLTRKTQLEELLALEEFEVIINGA